MSPRRSPRPLAAALHRARDRAQPTTLLAAVQSAWPAVAGARATAEAEPVAERDGVVTVSCHSATWAQELDLLQSELLERLNKALSELDPEALLPPLRGLRFTADASRHFYS
jgi:predicted nucleic acid-binding Zn ribbon protein